jgi:UDP-N-acetylglucosamine 2-epimerase (non-hydrolysing)
MKHIHLIAGARPNFMKVAPLWRALTGVAWAKAHLVHTGQHYDEAMSGVFFSQLGLPQPHYNLGVGSGTHAEQTSKIMLAYERLCLQNRPDFVIVVGDVNSTMACALVAAKIHIPIGHLEAGLRSGDRRMPEEINRMVTDAVSDVLWTPSYDADDNLQREGIPTARIECVGNIMIDCFELHKKAIENAHTADGFGLRARAYGVVTLHRPSNVDDTTTLRQILATLDRFSQSLPLIAPLHPRTFKQIKELGLQNEISKNITLTEPLGYVDFMSLVSEARLVITDSGGIQEETTYLDIPCLTLRSTTERPVTITHGTNELVDLHSLSEAVNRILANKWKRAQGVPLWDGRAATRVVQSLTRRLAQA